MESRLYFRVNQPVEDLVVCRLYLAVSVCCPTCFSSLALATAFFVRQVLKEHLYSTHRLVAWSPPACFSHGVLVLLLIRHPVCLLFCFISLIEEAFPRKQ